MISLAERLVKKDPEFCACAQDREVVGSHEHRLRISSISSSPNRYTGERIRHHAIESTETLDGLDGGEIRLYASLMPEERVGPDELNAPQFFCPLHVRRRA
jgi:hypothetical protein